MRTAALAFSLVVLPGAGQAQRVALVIGNSNYVEERSLSNPHRDADAISKLLIETLGFKSGDVTVLKDADYAATIEGLRAFQAKSMGAQLAVIFYSGHGIAFNDANYMAPVDVPKKLVMRNDATDKVIHLDEIQRTISAARIGIVFWDACRNNGVSPSMARGARATSASRDLIPVASGPASINSVATFLAFSTNPRDTADDGPDGFPSPFTQAIVKQLSVRGRTIMQAMAAVTTDVMTASQTYGKVQIPEVRAPRMSTEGLNFSFLQVEPGSGKSEASSTGNAGGRPAAKSNRAASERKSTGSKTPPSLGVGVGGGGMF